MTRCGQDCHSGGGRTPRPGLGGGDVTRRVLLGAGAALIAGADLATAQTASARAVVLGQVSLSFYAVTGAVVHEVLERLGHKVELRVGPHEQMFPLLGEEAIDIMAAAWLPEGHAAYWARYGTRAVEIARIYDGARFFWAVPYYVPESEVSAIDDLKKPSVAARMTKVIQGIGDGATISVVSRKALIDYQLDSAGYSFKPGTAADWTGAYDAAVSARQWIVFPTWAPQYLNGSGRLRPLKDPRGTLGSSNHGALVGPRSRFEALPPRSRDVLSRISLGLDGVTEMDRLVNVERRTPHDAARTWMGTNEARVAGWFRT